MLGRDDEIELNIKLVVKKLRFNKIFGGFIMRQAFELGWANAHVFGKFHHLDIKD